MGVRFEPTARLELGAAASILGVPIAKLIRQAVSKEVSRIRAWDEPGFRKALKEELSKMSGSDE